MADFLDRSDEQGIAREKFFRMHGKAAGLMGSGSLCISTLSEAALLSDPRGTPTTKNQKIPSSNRVEIDLKSSRGSETNAQVLKPPDCSVEQCKILSEETDNCSIETPIPRLDVAACSPTLTDKSDSRTVFDPLSEIDRCSGEEKSGVEVTVTHGGNQEVPASTYSVVLDSSPSVPHCNTEGVAVNQIERNLLDAGSDSKEITLDSSVTFSNDKVTESLKTLDIESSNEKASDLEFVEDHMRDYNLDSAEYCIDSDVKEEIIYSVEDPDSSACQIDSETECSVATENIDIKPDIHEISIYEDDSQDRCLSSDTEVLEVTPSNFLTVCTTVEDDKDQSQDPLIKSEVEIEEAPDFKESDVSVVKLESDDELESDGGKDTSVSALDLTECLSDEDQKDDSRVQVKETRRAETDHPHNLDRLRCTIRLVPKKEINVLNSGNKTERDHEEVSGNSSASLQNRFNSLTGTVKIGCLSVTPLNPSLKKEIKEELEDIIEPEVKIEDNFDAPDDSNKNSFSDEGIPENKKEGSLYLNNERWPKNNIDITISAKGAESGSDAVDTLQVKIPQLIDNFTGCLAPEKTRPTPRSVPDKNYIVNKNLKIIESFLMQKGFQKEANILKEKTDLIKPYLEDIALKMEKSINDINDARTRQGAKHCSPDDPGQFSRGACKRTDRAENEKSVERELAILTEKLLLGSYSMDSRHRPRRCDDYMDQIPYLSPCGMPSISDIKIHDRYYNKPYYDGSEYSTGRDSGSTHIGRMQDPLMSRVFRSSRHDQKEHDSVPSDISFYDHFSPEYDNMTNSPLFGSSCSFSHSDFSQFIDEDTAEKYNNFIHFMVPDFEAQSFDSMDGKKWREREKNLNGTGSSQPMNCCPPMVPMMNQFYPGHMLGQYGMLPQGHHPMMPPVHPYLISHLMSPSMGRQLPMDSSRESCGQLTITPLDESGKPYGPGPVLPQDATGCSQGLCGDGYPCTRPLPPAMMPSMPLVVPSDPISQQLTITPLHQSSSLPYLHRSLDSANRRRGRPPMDPEYAAVGYRKDAFANVRFSRADFMARVQSNVDHYGLDHRMARTSRTPGNTTVGDYLPTDQLKHSQVTSSAPENVVPPPPVSTYMPPPVSTGSSVTSSGDKNEVPAPNPKVLTKPQETVSKASPTSKVITSSKPPSSPPHVPVSNGYKKAEPSGEKLITKHVGIAPKQSNAPSKEVDPTKRSFQITSKQVKIPLENLLPNSNVKISLVNKKSVSSDKPAKPSGFSVTKMSGESNIPPELSGMLKKSIPDLKNIFINTNVSLRRVQSSSTPAKNNVVGAINKKEFEIHVKGSEVKLLPERGLEMDVSTNVKKEDKVNSSCVVEAVKEKKLLGLLDKSNTNSVVKSLVDSGATANKPVKVKKRRRFPQFKKKKKKLKVKSPGEARMRQAKPQKAVEEKSVVNIIEKSDTPSDKLVKFPEDDSLSDINLTNSNSNSCSNSSIKDFESGGGESSESHGDGVRRSCRKRKIIEGNPKFRDMERVDLKYFREERPKPVGIKRKLSLKQEPTPIKRSMTDQKPTSTKDQGSKSLTCGGKPEAKKEVKEKVQTKEEQVKSREKLQQFLQVNDIYLKPQTFV